MDGAELEHLVGLERSLWSPATRFDRAHLDMVLSAEFREFGRSGKVYDREAIMSTASEHFEAELDDVVVSFIGAAVALVTYRSAFSSGDRGVEYANRASLWQRGEDRPGVWRLVFHQATPIGGSG